MKKTTTLLLAALCLSLGACGNEAQTNSNDENSTPIETEQSISPTVHSTPAEDFNKEDISVIYHSMEKNDFFAVVKESSFSVFLSFNHQLKLYVGNDLKVKAVECVNDEAKTLFDGNTCVRTDEIYEVFLENILEKLYQEGYLEDGAQLRTEIIGASVTEDDMLNITTKTFSVFNGFQEEKKITLSITNGGGMTSELKTENDAENDATQNSKKDDAQEIVGSRPLLPNEEVLERDADGNIIQTQEIDSAGTVILRTYNSQGQMLTCITNMTDGNTIETSYTYYHNGNIKTCEMNEPIADIYELWTYSEDNTSRTKETNKATVTETFYSNGQLALYSCQAKPGQYIDDWTYDEYTYDTNGNTITHYRIRTNGNKMTSTYHSEDAFTMVVEYPGGGGHTEYWIGNTHIGGIDSDGNSYGDTHATYTGSGSGGTIGIG